ncbi:MAG: SpoIIE family protein phosphatase [Phycisphaerales bacterium]
MANETKKAVETPPLTLEPLNGATRTPLVFPTGREYAVGRSSECDAVIANPSVSRRHALFTRRGDQWLLTDLGSRHGVFLNDARLGANDSAPIGEGDVIAIGPCSFRASLGPRRTLQAHIMDDLHATTQRVEPATPSDLGLLASQRLELLFEYVSTITRATDERALAESLVRVATEGAGFPRAAFVRPRGDGDLVEIIALRSNKPSDRPESMRFSRSLLLEASKGELARLTANPDFATGQSIHELGIREAICAPIRLGPSIVGYLYTDARHMEPDAAPDASAFVDAIARLASVALASMKRQEAERRWDQLKSDLDAARRVQELVTPELSGVVGPVEYAVRIRPGRFVAGDLFDIVPIDDNRTLVTLGDVAGKGVSAGIVMGMAQSFLRAAIRPDLDLAALVSELNAYLAPRLSGRFVTMWVGVIDAGRDELTFVDAGHGHWLIGRPPQPPEVRRGDLPVGVDVDYRFHAHSRSFSIDDHLVLFSDGAIEQRSPGGDAFEISGVMRAISGDATVEEEVAAVFAALRTYAGKDQFADDVTVASIRRRGDPASR